MKRKIDCINIEELIEDDNSPSLEEERMYCQIEEFWKSAKNGSLVEDIYLRCGDSEYCLA